MSVKVHKEGVVLDPQAADPSNPKEGQLQFADGTARTAGLWQYVGSAWTQIPLGAGALSVATKTGAYTLSTTDDVVLGDANSASFTLTLPTAVGNSGKVFYIHKTNSDITKLVTIDGDGTETIDGNLTLILAQQNNSISIVSDGSNWVSISKNIAGAICIIEDQKSSGTKGGASVTNTANIRDLNTLLGDTSFVSLSSNQFTLQPGRYHLSAKCPGKDNIRAQAFVYAFGGPGYVMDGLSQSFPSGIGMSTHTTVEGFLDISVATVYEIRHYTQNGTAVEGLGPNADNTGNPQSTEIYTRVTITKLR